MAVLDAGQWAGVGAVLRNAYLILRSTLIHCLSQSCMSGTRTPFTHAYLAIRTSAPVKYGWALLVPDHGCLGLGSAFLKYGDWVVSGECSVRYIQEKRGTVMFCSTP